MHWNWVNVAELFTLQYEIPVFFIFDMAVKNTKSGISSLYSLTGKCAAQKLKKNLYNSSLWTCLHHNYGHINKPK